MDAKHHKRPCPKEEIIGLVRALLEQKERAKGYGDSVITISFKSGQPALLKVTDTASHKFDTERE